MPDQNYCHLLLEAIPHSLFLKDRKSVYLDCNRHFAATLDRTPDEIIGKTDYDFFPRELAEKYCADDQRVMETGEPSQFDELLDEKRWVRTIKTPIRDDRGIVTGVHGIFWEITAEKQAEDQMREQESLFRHTFEQAAVGIAHLSLDGSCLRVNKRLSELVGYSCDELMGRSLRDLTHPDDLLRDQTFMAQLLAGMMPRYSMEKRFIRPSREYLWCNATVSLVRDQSDEPEYFIAVIEDIGDRKFAEEELMLYRERLENMVAERTRELSRSEVSLKEAQRLAQIGSWELSLLTNRLSWSDEIFRIFEIDPKHVGASYEAFLERVHPDDRETVSAAYTASLADRTPYDIVYRLMMTDGRVKHVHERGETDYDQNDQAICSRGTLQDVTERWQIEQRLRQLSQAVEQSPSTVLITDVSGKITYINPCFTELTGYAWEEAVGQNVRILKSDITPASTHAELWQQLSAGKSWRGEFCNRKKNGELYWESAAISPLINDDGVTTNYIAVKEDITQRKLDEKRLRELSLVDELTGLSNRRSFQMLAKQMLKVAARTKGRICLIYVDVDDFKSINDSCGHREGDNALKDVAQILRNSCRAADIVGRLGGDEFALLATDVAGDTPDRILNRLEENLQAHALEGERPFRLSLSCGVAMYEPGSTSTLEELLEKADRMMYREKQRHHEGLR